MDKVLMVCVGNICRSPVAEGLLQYYSTQKGLNLQVSSAGIQALVGYEADPASLFMMKEKGIDISLHRARQLTEDILREVDLVLVMETWQQKEIGAKFPSVYGKVHRLGKWGNFEIPDPYRKSMDKFEETYTLIEQGLQEWQKKLWK